MSGWRGQVGDGLSKLCELLSFFIHSPCSHMGAAKSPGRIWWGQLPATVFPQVGSCSGESSQEGSDRPLNSTPR